MQPTDRVRRFRLRRGRRRGGRLVVPCPSPTGRPWREARLSWEYRRRYAGEEEKG